MQLHDLGELLIHGRQPVERLVERQDLRRPFGREKVALEFQGRDLGAPPCRAASERRAPSIRICRVIRAASEKRWCRSATGMGERARRT